jgi:hypothetical protein
MVVDHRTSRVVRGLNIGNRRSLAPRPRLSPAEPSLRVPRFSGLKLPVNAAGENIHWSAAGVVSGIVDELIIEGELSRGEGGTTRNQTQRACCGARSDPRCAGLNLDGHNIPFEPPSSWTITRIIYRQLANTILGWKDRQPSRLPNCGIRLHLSISDTEKQQKSKLFRIVIECRLEIL